MERIAVQSVKEMKRGLCAIYVRENENENMTYHMWTQSNIKINWKSESIILNCTLNPLKSCLDFPPKKNQFSETIWIECKNKKYKQ